MRVVVCALGACLALLHLSSALLLGAFNIKSFGDKKASNITLMDIISTIVHRYDIILIQEVRDSDLSATRKLMEHVNKGAPQFRYSHIVSEPLGRSSYKERYLFLYREQTVSVAKNYTYNDDHGVCGTDTFMREPFVVMFSSKHTVVQNFTLIPQHTSPDSAVEEVDALYDVVNDVFRRWKNNDIVLLGDFNAGCSYVTDSEWEKIRLFTDKSFHWLIPGEADTTVTHTDCPYDRIVVTTDMMRGVAQGSPEVYNYMEDLGLSHDLALAVSDHFPVEVTLSEKRRSRVFNRPPC
ncbi:deoxyribonuclease-1 [Brachionichthys hirsutus]|uniref:deoxyribonuclease-1 n=1 Tax=Brachionichthys hirsutus TaxID=412623 RepID=UPI003604372D